MSDGQAWAPPGSGAPHDGPSGTHRTPRAAPPAADAVADGPPPGGWLGADRAELLGGDIPLRPLGVAEILDGAIVNIRHNPRGVLGLALVITTVVQVLQSMITYFLIGDYARDEITPVPIMRSLGAQLTVSLLGLLMSAYAVLLLAGLLAPAMGRTLFGLPAAPGQVWRDARPRLAHLIGVATLIMMISVLAAVLPVVPFIIAVSAPTTPAAAGVLAGLVGFPAGFVLMVWLYVLFVLAAPAVVLERQGVLASLARARQLTKGRWWRVGGILLLTLLITIFMGFFALRVPFVVAEFVFFGDDLSGGEVFLQLALDTAGRIVSWTLTIPFDAGVIALLYVDRRMRREGFDLELQTRETAAARPADFLDLWRPVPAAPLPPAAPAAWAAPAAPPGGWPR
ncbi:MAG TPA: hypothetical protein VFU43_04580 [Streptosporangiaceae bacterium]|nr:hypothetical protein [Streptosporangiaceae bacterium]